MSLILWLLIDIFLLLNSDSRLVADFLPHLPSLDIRDGALDYLFNVYRRILPGLGGYLTDHGGKVNLDRVDVILAEVGSIEDYVFEMKHANEQREKARREQYKQNGTGGGKMPAGGIANAPQESFQKMGRSARIMAENGSAAKQGTSSEGDVKLQRGYMAKEELRKKLKGKPSSEEENAKAAEALKQQLLGAAAANPQEEEEEEVKEEAEPTEGGGALKRKAFDMASAEGDDDDEMFGDSESVVGDPDFDETEEETEEDRALMDEAHKNLKEKVKAVESAKLDDYAKNVKDNVRLHEPGWKVR